jgi:hypothetical protein
LSGKEKRHWQSPVALFLRLSTFEWVENPMPDINVDADPKKRHPLK